MPPRPRIALLIGQDIAFCRRLLQGIHSYAVTKGWVFHDTPADVRVLDPMWKWKPDGIICSLYDQDIAERLKHARVPVVNTSGTVSWRGPLVDVDHLEVGRLAAEHLLERRLRNFGFLGSATYGSAVSRGAGFRKRLALEGFVPSLCHAEYRPTPPLTASWHRLERPVRDWLLKLPKPVGIMASHDRPGRDLAELCHQLNLRVPDTVAILGVDDDEFECRLSTPPLSSVHNPAVKIGYEAARLLDCLMSGPKPDAVRIAIPPSHVVIRQSTQTTAVDDPDIAAALVWIRDHVSEDMSVERVAAQVGMSRRTLERRFRAVVGDSVLAEIRRMRIERARQLLADTNLRLSRVAEQCGFRDAARFATTFKQATGHAPSAFRRTAADQYQNHQPNA